MFITKHLVIFVLSICLEINFYHQTSCDFCPIYLSGNMKEFMEKIWKSEEFVWNIWRIFKEKWKAHMEKCWIWLKKWKNLCVKNLEKWRICMETWRIYLFLKKSEEFPWKNDEFAWTSERIYMVQRYSKYRFFDVNCILKYSKYRFSSSIPGMPGETKISIPYSMWVEDLICLYIYMHTKVIN